MERVLITFSAVQLRYSLNLRFNKASCGVELTRLCMPTSQRLSMSVSAASACVRRGLHVVRFSPPLLRIPRGLRAAGLQVLLFASSAASAVVQPDSCCFCGATCLLIHVDS